jgi:hypothetical protein
VVVDEALCFGWIDGKAQRIDEQRYRQRLSPRRRNSNWGALNVAKVAELRAQGRMSPAGEAAFSARREDSSGTLSYERRHEAAFDAEQEAAFSRERAGVEVVRSPIAFLPEPGDVLGRQRQAPGERHGCSLRESRYARRVDATVDTFRGE